MSTVARIRDGIPVLDPVAGHVHVVADQSVTVVAVFTRGPYGRWWTPFGWSDDYSHRDYIPFGCGSVSVYHDGHDHPATRVIRCHITHALLDSWTTVASVLKEVLDREQYLELRDILEEPTDATRWGPWMTAIETGR